MKQSSDSMKSIVNCRLSFVPQRGQIALSLTLLLGGIIILIATTLAVVVMALLNSSIGFQNSNKAFVIASGGIEDALLQVARNKDFEDTAGYCVPAASIPCPSGSATVTVARNTPSAGLTTIISESVSALYKRRAQAIASVNGTTGELKLISWNLTTF